MKEIDRLVAGGWGVSEAAAGAETAVSLVQVSAVRWLKYTPPPHIPDTCCLSRSLLRCPLLFQINLTSVTMAGDDEELSLLLSTISSQPVTQEDINSLLFSLPTTTAPSMISYPGYEQFEAELGPHNIADTDMVSSILTTDLYPVLPVPVPEVPRVRSVSVCVSR